MFYLVRKVRDFSRAEAGNVVVIFAISLVPIVAGVGAAIDFTHASSTKAGMQAAADATALMMAKADGGTSNPQTADQASSIFKGLFTRTEANNVQASATYEGTDTPTVVVTASASLTMSFMKVFGTPEMMIVTRAAATAAPGKMAAYYL